MQESLRIELHARVHITLIGLDEFGIRRNGGLGFAVSDPKCVIVCTPSDRFSVYDSRESALGPTESSALLNSLLRLCERRGVSPPKFSIQIQGGAPTHFGFGTGTAIRLGCLEALSELLQLKLTRQDLVLASGRGGTSGVGVNTYFDGGMVMDLGRAVRDQSFRSSEDESNASNQPLLLRRVEMPPWEIGICIPNLQPKSVQEEQAFFANTCPITSASVHRTLYESLFGTFASVIEEDSPTFCRSLSNIQGMEWKSAEWGLYGDPLRKIEQSIYSAGATVVAMSSLGPGLFFLGPSVQEAVDTLRFTCPGCRWLVTRPRNVGREMMYA